MSNLLWLPRSGDSLPKAAAEYAANGWPVFPCRGKTPLTHDGFKAATAEQERVSHFWERWPDANIGWPLLDNWFALDVDPRHGGDASLRDLERKNGCLPMTLRAITGSGGEHWIFRSPRGVELRQLAGFAPGLDTRLGQRGYLLIAPSVHPETKQPYQWLAAIEPVEPPRWLVDMVRVPESKPVEPYVAPSTPREMDRRRRYALAALEGLADEVRGSGKGQRNNALNRAWHRMAQFRDAIERREAEAVLLQAAIDCGLSEREARQVMR